MFFIFNLSSVLMFCSFNMEIGLLLPSFEKVSKIKKHQQKDCFIYCVKYTKKSVW